MINQFFDELYERGATAFPFFSPERINKVLDELASVPMQKAKEYEGNNVYQNFHMAQINPYTFPETQYCIKFIEEYFNERLFTTSEKFIPEPIRFNDFFLHKYDAKGEIQPHRDDKGFKKMVCILLLKGESCFYIANDKKKTNKTLINAKPGHCIALEAPGLFGRNKQPVHFVEGITQERITLGLREGKVVSTTSH